MTPGELKTEVARLKNLLGRYADHVGESEGTDFLGGVITEDDFITEAEAKEIISYCPSGRGGK